ncbi:unnamed protein product [Lepeophtheirus salmonis]|uniref:(salmon louse) hypothetical protein n=1 Tax=Lepeophtheirus salmonis TaxID=72036 RepID=A0A7R8CVL4_LEPSM|nr:unnamed protein product [Lepeophtheirus salmonis]CAF2945834.1 unnamed protein product [Lepeophtheirus salmonis]
MLGILKNEPSLLSRKRRQKETFVWHKDSFEAIDVVSDYEVLNKFASNEEDSVEILELIGHYWTIERLDCVFEQSKLYAEQKSLAHDCVTRDNMRVFFVILIVSGYNKL